MSTKDFTANVISATKVVPDGNFKDSKASGIWDINEALDLIKGGNWPNVANVNPSAFVDGLFNTTLYTGDNSTATQTFNTGLNMSGKGGLIWFKSRSSTQAARIIDTVRGTNESLIPSSSNGSGGLGADGLTFLNNGFSIGWDGGDIAAANDYVAWSFRKQPKFFDIVTYTGDNSTQTVNHNLGSVPGMIMVKRLNDAGNWGIKHRSIDATDGVFLNLTDGRYDNATYWGDTEPTSTQFTVGTTHSVDSAPYVAYLFAHNDDDGGFGEPGDQDIIKCGSFTSDSNGIATVDLGFEPQWVLFKGTHNGSSWFIVDIMRGMVNGSNDAWLAANLLNAEGTSNTVITPTPTGFVTDGTNIIDPSETFIYMAIRRGGMQTPTAASSVFNIDTFGSTGDGAAPAYRSSFPVDMGIYGITNGTADRYIASRLTGPQYLRMNAANAQADGGADYAFDFNNGWWNSTSTIATYVSYMWARARGYFDLATWTGTGSSLNVSHNLGVEPEMIWVKTRSNAVGWAVYNKTEGFSKGARLELNGAYGTETNRVTGASSTTFTVGTDAYVNVSARTYIAYLFATVADISKVGSFTQSGATNVSCGFSGDTPSLVILKRTDDTGNWYILRSIVSGNDKSFYLNDDSAEVSNADIVDPYSGGFATTSSLTDGDYIFYAIAAIS